MHDPFIEDLSLTPTSPGFRGLGLSARASRVCMIADTLSWAVRHNLSIPDALRTLPFFSETGSPVLLLLHLPDFIKNATWSARVRGLIQDIEGGERLSVALRKQFALLFPEFYYLGLERAEESGSLPTALPVLALQLNYPCDIARERRAELAFVASKLIQASAIIFFITANIVPKFQMIFDDLCEGASVPPVAAVFGILGSIAGWVVVIIIIFALLPKLGIAGECAILHVPIIGRDMKRMALADVASSMAAFIRQGDDVLTAAEWSQKASRSKWLSQRLGKFIEAVNQGAPWPQAWIAMNVGRPLEQWVIQNAASREDPASGFELLSEWLHQEAGCVTRRLECWIDPIATLTIAIVVGTLAYFMMSILTDVMYSLL